jgi:hypothetical protein
MSQDQQAAASSNSLPNVAGSAHAADAGNVSPQEDDRDEGGIHEPSAPSGSGAETAVGSKRPVRGEIHTFAQIPILRIFAKRKQLKIMGPSMKGLSQY